MEKFYILVPTGGARILLCKLASLACLASLIQIIFPLEISHRVSAHTRNTTETRPCPAVIDAQWKKRQIVDKEKHTSCRR